MPPKRIHNLARNLRKNQTDAESLLWSKLRARQISGFKFRRQHPIGRFIVDFYCKEANLAIEIDGSQHLQVEAIKYDEARIEFLKNEGIRVIRFWNHEVLLDLNAVLETIDLALNQV